MREKERERQTEREREREEKDGLFFFLVDVGLRVLG